MIERWKPVIGYEDRYKVSSLGKILAIRWHREDGRVYPVKFLAQSIQNGYPCVSLYRRKDGKRAYVHRLVAEAFLPPCPKGYEVNHIDGDKRNASALNLEWVTKSENQIHAVRLGLRPRRTSGSFSKGNLPWNAGMTGVQTAWNKGMKKDCYLAEQKLLPSL